MGTSTIHYASWTGWGLEWGWGKLGGRVVECKHATKIYWQHVVSRIPRDPITLSVDDWGVQSPSKRKVFRFHYHSQKVIGSLGNNLLPPKKISMSPEKGPFRKGKYSSKQHFSEGTRMLAFGWIDPQPP